MKTLIVILSLFIFALNGIAQKEFLKGYIITNAGDTVYGKIKQYKPFEKIKFIKNKSSEEVAYRPKEIKAYSVNDTLFYESNAISTGPIINYYFMEKVISGYLCAYYFDEMNSFSSARPTNIKITNGKFTTDNIPPIYALKKEGEEKSLRINLMTFKDQISGYLKDDTELCKKILNKEYTYKNIENIVKEYNNWYSKKGTKK